MQKMTKKEKVEEHLNYLMESDDFSIDDLLKLTVADLLKAPQLKGIGKITISGVLSSFIKKYDENFFNDIDDIDDTVVFEPENTNSMVSGIKPTPFVFNTDEVNSLRKIIKEHKIKKNSEIIELKMALKNAGIDYMMILKDYRSQKELELKEWEESVKY